MTSELTLIDIVRSAHAAEPGLATEELARRVQEKCSPAQLFEAVHHYVLNWQRSQVRSVEHEIGGWADQQAPSTGHLTEPKGHSSVELAVDPDERDPLAARRDLLNRGVPVPRRGNLTWGEMTVEDHRARIAMLSATRRGIDRTIRLHEDAIEAIQEAGVTNLNELYGEPAA
jgi:hypothetical protein